MHPSVAEIIKGGSYSLVDVRSIQEFTTAHLPGALHIPVDALQLNLSLINELPRPIILYCHSGFRSGLAVEFLQQHGIEGSINGGGLSQLIHFFEH
ncbi:MAG: rhodanese-like domain-containing protein [Bacteroidota bacterium]